MIEVSLKQIMEDLLRDLEATRRRFSKNGAGREPREGYELAFETEQEKERLIREHIRDMEAGKAAEDTIVRLPAPWQRAYMNGDMIDIETGEIVQGRT